MSAGDDRPSPQTALVTLARRYTADELRDAGHKAATYGVEQALYALARMRDADEIVPPDEAVVG